MSAAAFQPPPLPPPDRVRVIRRSMRCFMFGVAGAVPCFGLGMVWLAFKLFRDVAAETGECVWLFPRRVMWLFPLHAITLIGTIVPALCFLIELPGWVLLDALVALGLQLLFIRLMYVKNKPVEWNPARHLMYWGLALAQAGLLLSIIVVMLAIYFINQS